MPTVIESEDEVLIVETASEETSVVTEQDTAEVVTEEQETTIVDEAPATTTIVVEEPVIEFIEECAQCPTETPSAGGGGGAVFALDITPTAGGIVGSKAYEPDTVPADVAIVSGVTDVDEVTVHVQAEGGSDLYTPVVTIDGVQVTNFQQYPDDRRVFYGSVDLVITASKTVDIVSSAGTTDSVYIERAEAGPEIIDLTFGAYPGTQTELKAGDTISVSVAVENAATQVALLTYGAVNSVILALQPADGHSPGYRYATGTATISSGTGLLSARAVAENSLGTPGTEFTSIDQVLLNQTYPSISIGAIDYPLGQQALKGSESATVNHTVSDFDTILYTDTGLDVTNPTTYEAAKVVTRLSGGYVNSGNNLTITANRAANDATSVSSTLVVLADTAPQAYISIDGSPARLRSSAAGENYVVRINPDQVLLSAPTLDASIGTWTGSWNYHSGSNSWYRTLVIDDTDAKGAGVFSNLAMTGLALVPGTVITAGDSYTVGGFTSRLITFPAFAQWTDIGTPVADFTKTRARYSGTTSDLDRYTDTAYHFDGFTITDAAGTYDPNGDQLFLSDSAFAGSNSSGTLQVEVEELA